MEKINYCGCEYEVVDYYAGSSGMVSIEAMHVGSHGLRLMQLVWLPVSEVVEIHITRLTNHTFNAMVKRYNKGVI